MSLFAAQVDLYDFHTKFGLEVHEQPTKPTQKTLILRQSLVEEEMVETTRALINLQIANDQESIHEALAELADGIADAIYVLIGTAVSCGIDMKEVWEAVHTANMRKTGGAIREDGKILKPEGWKPPDVAGIIERQMR